MPHSDRMPIRHRNRTEKLIQLRALYERRDNLKVTTTPQFRSGIEQTIANLEKELKVNGRS